MTKNRQWPLARHPELEEVIGLEHFHIAEEAIPNPEEGELVLKTSALGTSQVQRSHVSTSLSMHE